MNENAGNHAAVNSLELYCEIHGEGGPCASTPVPGREV